MVNNEEKQYLQLIKRCIVEGEYQDDRTGTGTYGVFGTQMRYSLENNAFPLLTTKKTSYKSILGELLFFIRGQTDNKILMEKGVKIWNGNSTKEYFEKVGINREANDLGLFMAFNGDIMVHHMKRVRQITKERELISLKKLLSKSRQIQQAED